MKASELINKPSSELTKQLVDLGTKLNQLNSDLRVKDVKNVRTIRAVKRDVARIKTVLRQQQLAEAQS